jgi:hypothetical protein
MTTSGVPYLQTVQTQSSPDEVMQAFVIGTAGVGGYTVNQAGPGTLILTRRYWPVWVLVVAVLGALFFLIGLLVLLYRETETLTVTVRPAPGGSEVHLSGTVSPDMSMRLSALLSHLSGQPVFPSVPAYPTATVAPQPRLHEPDVPAAVANCQNGHPIAPEQMFCPTCGAAAPARCRNGHAVAASEMFCTSCGVPVEGIGAVPPDSGQATA